VTTVDTATAAVATGRSERTIRRWVAAGVIPNRGTPRKVRVLLADLVSASVCSDRRTAA
jgi:hypothetical protein